MERKRNSQRIRQIYEMKEVYRVLCKNEKKTERCIRQFGKILSLISRSERNSTINVRNEFMMKSSGTCC